MKAFSLSAKILAATLASLGAQAAPEPVVSGPWAELRNSPLFEAPTQKLAPTWGPAIPVGNGFQVEKVYGRWLYGTPTPLARMPKGQEAKPGWIFSRMLLVPGDEDTLSSAQVSQARAVLYHGRKAWESLKLGTGTLTSPLDFYEGLTLSRGTLAAFSKQDESAVSWTEWKLPPLLPFFEGSTEAHADEKADEKAPSMGLTGTDLNFLDQEFAVKRTQAAQEEKVRNAKKLKPPGTPALDDKVRTALLGRFMLEKYLDLPPITHEEVDGYIYMRATAMRALEGCPATIQDYWKSRRWNLFRVFRLKSRQEVRHPWLEISLPGGYYAFSARALELAGNEAEMAYLLVRPLVREMRIEKKAPKFAKKAWPASLNSLSEELWDQVLRAQSTKDSENLDAADEIAVDLMAIECISRAGYRPMAGLSYLRKLSAKKEEPWAAWFRENSIGVDYRVERVNEILTAHLAAKKFPEGQASNPKRFSTAARHWNVMP